MPYLKFGGSKKTTLAEVHSENPDEEYFLRVLERNQKIYFNWGFDELLVLRNPGNPKDDISWLNMGAERFEEIAKMFGATSAGTVAVLGKLGLEVVIYCFENYGPNTDESQKAFIEQLEQAVPEIKISFLKE